MPRVPTSYDVALPPFDGVGAPLHRQLYLRLRDAILAGRISAGSRLPSSRALAAQLGLSRNTVVSAVDQLAAEGILELRRGSGTYVAPDLLGPGPHAPRPQARVYTVRGSLADRKMYPSFGSTREVGIDYPGLRPRASLR